MAFANGAPDPRVAASFGQRIAAAAQGASAAAPVAAATPGVFGRLLSAAAPAARVAGPLGVGASIGGALAEAAFDPTSALRQELEAERAAIAAAPNLPTKLGVAAHHVPSAIGTVASTALNLPAIKQFMSAAVNGSAQPTAPAAKPGDAGTSPLPTAPTDLPRFALPPALGGSQQGQTAPVGRAAKAAIHPSTHSLDDFVADFVSRHQAAGTTLAQMQALQALIPQPQAFNDTLGQVALGLAMSKQNTVAQSPTATTEQKQQALDDLLKYTQTLYKPAAAPFTMDLFQQAQ